ncbi:hypothetical protein PV350_44855 [Streptomyces sp. PA03-6a]|nr:hypothetical protein [Streptomyces sp. PA03-6a]
MDAALAGLAGTTVGAVAGVAGAWLAQRGQLRALREQRTHEERVRWLDDKRAIYRDLLNAMYGWHDALVSIWQDNDNGRLTEHATPPTKESWKPGSSPPTASGQPSPTCAARSSTTVSPGSYAAHRELVATPR